MSNCLLLFSAVPWLLIALLLSSSSLPLSRNWWGSACPSANASSTVSQSPFSPSWNSWWHPHLRLHQETYSSSTRNLFYHLGGYGPWIEKREGVVTGDNAIGPPKDCVVDSVHMMSRHSERYPTFNAGRRHLQLLNKIKQSGLVFNESLAFVNNWTYITDSPDVHFEQLTQIGPYAGTLQAFVTGTRLRTRYSHLLPRDSPLRFWASDSQRVIDTARHFAAGLFGLDWESQGKAELEIIPETLERGADTLTPGDSCVKYIDDLEKGHDYGMNMLSKFQDVYIPAISARLLRGNPNMEFTNAEIFAMQELCGFETLVRGSSPWCLVFTDDDWDHFEYARDLVHYYRAGPGNPYAPAMGWLWLNATTELLREFDDEGGLFFSFVHDGDIAPMLTALGIFDDDTYDPNLPITHIARDRVWRTSQVMPMGGRIIFERLSCSSQSNVTEYGQATNRYIRININDGIVPLPDCDTGPGFSCPLTDFAERTRLRGIKFGQFEDVCGLEKDARKRITFLRQY
ncbi:hypothetical protein VTO42DRAFT_7797 [Malbranchea cinnamomea]